LIARFQTAAQSIMLRKSARIDRAANDVQILRRDRVVMLEMIADHVAVDDNQRLLGAQILPAFE
jgi:hypothetical protein